MIDKILIHMLGPFISLAHNPSISTVNEHSMHNAYTLTTLYTVYAKKSTGGLSSMWAATLPYLPKESRDL